MVRFLTFQVISLLFAIYAVSFSNHLQTIIARSLTLIKLLFNETVDATLLDWRITFECEPARYTFGTSQSDLDFLSFYRTKLGTELF